MMRDYLIRQEEIFLTNDREWLVCNGIGGFACGTISGIPTRKYHSLLNASLPAPFGRTVMLNYVLDEVISGENSFPLTAVHLSDQVPKKMEWLVEFRLEDGIPYWKYESHGIVIEKSLFMIHQQNTACLFYELLSEEAGIFLKWRPYFHFRMHEQAVNVLIENENYQVSAMGSKYEIECPHFPKLRLINDAQASYFNDYHELKDVFYEVEFLRGYESVGNLKSPGFFSLPLKPYCKTPISISTEAWSIVDALTANEAFKFEKFRKRNLLKMAGGVKTTTIKSKLALAADQFLITPTLRIQDRVKLQAAGEELRSIIAGFPWFTDWGRDTMISLEGLTLCTGRFKDAHAILYTFSQYMKNGLIPNMFPDGASEGIYNTADASLWFFHAIDRYIEMTGDTGFLEVLLPSLKETIHHYLNGTLFGIYADPNDGLLVQGDKNFALTWMDAKLDNWIVTPRRGKAVEINGLWYNALKLFEKWTNTHLPITKLCHQSFNEKFWYADGKYLYDLIDGEEGEKDPSLRPNQLFSISLSYPVLKKERWKQVLKTVERELLTKYGLRTLAPSDPKYRPYYHGDLTARDGAYHQGTVWPWLIGPFIDSWLKVYPENQVQAMQFLDGLLKQLHHGCIGSLAEIHDAHDPFQARGCFAQAWSIAEVLRILHKLDINPE